MSVAELRRLLPALRESEEQRSKRLWWSSFCGRHQADAQHHHIVRRARQAQHARPPGPPPLLVSSVPELTPAHWVQISPLLPRSRLGRREKNYRLMVEGIVWVLRTGGSWRSLSAYFGPWQAVSGCYHRWRHEGVWEKVRQVLVAPDIPSSSSA